jgi:hypothetical protein
MVCCTPGEGVPPAPDEEVGGVVGAANQRGQPLDDQLAVGRAGFGDLERPVNRLEGPDSLAPGTEWCCPPLRSPWRLRAGQVGR